MIDIAIRASSRLKILKALAHTSWGHQKETLLTTYKSIIQPIINYAAPIWYPNASVSSIRKLQNIQNAALRIVTGCHKKSPVQHLHTETKMLPVDKHLDLLCTQFLANTLRPLHVLHTRVTTPPGPRKMKETLYSKSCHSLQQHLHDGIIPQGNYKKVISSLHSAAVASTICEAGPNSVLGLWPPSIDKSELSLLRPHRSTLAQLRSGYCVSLRSYLFSIGRAENSLCPKCRAAHHDPPHLFNCPAYPTNLTVWDLWACPRETAAFLTSLPSFSHLPPVSPPPPAIPPEPPSPQPQPLD